MLLLNNFPLDFYSPIANLSARNSTFMFIFANCVPGGVAHDPTHVIDIMHACSVCRRALQKSQRARICSNWHSYLQWDSSAGRRS